jgi:hypothetical protein
MHINIVRGDFKFKEWMKLAGNNSIRRYMN